MLMWISSSFFFFKKEEQLQAQQADVSVQDMETTVEAVGLFPSSMLLTQEGCLFYGVF